MLSDIWTYFCALVSNWAGIIWAAELALLVGGLLLSKEQNQRVSAFLDGYIDEGKRLRWLRGLLVVALVVSGFLAWDEQYRIAMNSKSPDATVQNQVKHLQAEVDVLLPLISEVSNLKAQMQLSVIAKEQAALAKPGSIKQQALELSSMLLGRATQIQIWTMPHPGGVCTGGPNSAMHLDPNSPTFKAMQQEWEKCKAKLMKAQADAAALISDYNNTYANQVLSLRDGFMAQGQKGWRDKGYYSGVHDVGEIQQIGRELLAHANSLE